MTTNNEIIKKHNIRATIGTQNELLAEIHLCMGEARAEGYAEGRRDALDEKWEADKKHLAKQMLEGLDALCGDTGIGLGLDLEDSLCNNARDSEKFRKRLFALKKKWGIE
jgi:hypothetical protein